MIFAEMGYQAKSPYHVELSGRGRKEVDVYIKDERASVNQIMLVECKSWSSRVPQDTVHSMHTVMQGAGANTGFIISKRGFQRGAREAAKNTNIHLLTWDELQHKFGRQWFSHQSENLEKFVTQLRLIDHLHLSQNDPAILIHNNMVFSATKQWREFSDILADVRMVLFAAMAQPKSYDVPGPIEIAVHFDTAGAVLDSHGLWSLFLPSVRAYFEWILQQAMACLAAYEVLANRARAEFELLPDDVATAAFDRAFTQSIEEMPIRVFRDWLGDEVYFTLIKQVSVKEHAQRISLAEHNVLYVVHNIQVESMTWANQRPSFPAGLFRLSLALRT
jgi:hypothetical protein